MTATETTKVVIAKWSELRDRQPAHALVENVDLVVIRYDDQISVLYGRCHHRGALLSDGYIEGQDLIFGVHFGDYRFDAGVSAYTDLEVLAKFGAWVDKDADTVSVDRREIAEWAHAHPQPYLRDQCLGAYADTHSAAEELFNRRIR